MGKKSYRYVSFLLLFFGLFFSPSIFGETILLKSGSVIEGEILERTDLYIKVDFEGTLLTYYFYDIESIDGYKIDSATPQEEEQYITEEDKRAIETKKREAIAPLEINEAFMTNLFNFIRSAKGSNSAKYYGAAVICFGLSFYNAVLEHNEILQDLQGRTDRYVIIDPGFLIGGKEILTEHAKASYRQAINMSAHESDYRLGLAFINLLQFKKQDNFKFLEKVLDELIAIDSNSALPYYFKAFAYEKKDIKKYKRKAWLNIVEGLSRPINLDLSKMYSSAFELMQELGYHQKHCEELAAIITKVIQTSMLFTVDATLKPVTEESFIAKSFFEWLFRTWKKKRPIYVEAAVIGGSQFIASTPQSFMAELLGAGLKNAGYKRLQILHIEAKDPDAVSEIGGKLKTLAVFDYEKKIRSREIKSTIYKYRLDHSDEILNFVVDSLLVGEEKSAVENLGL